MLGLVITTFRREQLSTAISMHTDYIQKINTNNDSMNILTKLNNLNIGINKVFLILK